MEISFVIKTSQTELLNRQLEDVCKLFDVKVEVDPELEEGINWVRITNGDDNKRDAAKTYIIALCDPEIKERISFPGFPVYIFTAFEERCKQSVEKDCGVVLSVSDGNDSWIDVQGTNIGVTLATSKIHHLNKLHKDKSNTELPNVAKAFDTCIETSPQKRELNTLSYTLKKEILEMLGIPVEEDAKIPIQEIVPTVRPKALPRKAVVSPSTSPEVIEIEDTNESAILITSGSDGSEEESSDGENRLEYDGPSHDSLTSEDIKYILPPNFVIKEWIKANYEGTSDPAHYVSKANMLQHFKKHFDLPDHPELANTFFDKLAVRIFPQDPAYRSVKTKRTKSKHNRRRLVCLRRKTLSEGDKDEETKEVPAKSVVSDWNANRTVPKEIKMDADASMRPATTTASPPTQPWVLSPGAERPTPPRQPVPPQPDAAVSMRPATTTPSPPTQPWVLLPGAERPAPPRPPQPTPRPIVNPARWQKPNPPLFNIERQRQPPMPLITPQMVMARPLRPNFGIEPQVGQKSIEYRVSRMNNKELVHARIPCPNPLLRPIVIDGSNVAMSHGNSRRFSCRGIAICARVFMERGHGSITCFVPNYRKGGRGNPPSDDAPLLTELERIGIVKCTPSRKVRGANVVCYDDRFIVELAHANGGIIISNDQYRDLMAQSPRWRPIIENRLLQFTLVDDLFMFPEDPLGRNGPTLENFLMISIDRNGPVEQGLPVQEASPVRQVVPQAAWAPPPAAGISPARLRAAGSPVRPAGPRQREWPLVTGQQRQDLFDEMLKVMPGRDEDVRRVMDEHPREGRIDRLMNYLLISDTGS